MPAERQVTWRGCARDWITEGELFKLALVLSCLVLSRGKVVPGTGSQRVSSSNCQAHLLKQNYKIGFIKTRQEIDRLLKIGIYLIFTGTTME